MSSQRHRVGQLIVKHEHVERYVHTHAMGMRHGAAARKLVIRKAMGRSHGVKAAQPRIDGIGARGDGRKHLVEPARRRQQLGSAAPAASNPVSYCPGSAPSSESPSTNSLPRYAFTLKNAVFQHTRGLARPVWFIV